MKSKTYCLLFFSLISIQINSQTGKDSKKLSSKQKLSDAQNKQVPFSVLDLFDLNQPKTLGLSFAPQVETFTVFKPGENDNKYNHGVVLYPFKGVLYAQWQSSAQDEDGDDTQVFYSKSLDEGKTWSKPLLLSEDADNCIKTRGGWWSYQDTLVAYICVWPKNEQVKQGYTEYRISADGAHWSASQPVLNCEGKAVKGIIEQDTHALPNGRLLTAFHMQPGLRATPYFTDDPMGTKGWKAGKIDNLPTSKTISREIEPAWFYRRDKALVMIFRDQQSTFKKLSSISYDMGENWTTPVIIDTPDSRAKQSAGNLSDGTAFMVNNPSGNKTRFPLVITLSKDGFVFDKAFLIRSGGDDLQALRYQGKYKRVGYSYPKSIVWKQYLYVAYATNKEDVEISRIPIKYLQYK